MVVLAQLVFMGQLHGLSAAEADKRARRWASRLQISEALPKKTEELSKGMQQKIQFIASLMHDPDLVILDEPFSGLDPVNASLLQDTMIELRNEGKAILFSTHRMDQVERMCDAITLIHRGRVVLEGPMREVKNCYPRNRVEVLYSGDRTFLQNSQIADFKDYAGRAEITLRGTDAQPVLADAVAHGTRIEKFEVKEPTLEEIFISSVGGRVDA